MSAPATGERISSPTMEILREGVWALRGLNMLYGVAERASPWLAWTEGVEGGALKILREQGAVIEKATGQMARTEIGPQHWRLEAAGKSLLEAGPVAVDLLTLGVRTAGKATVEIAGIPDPVFASAICRIATQRGLDITASAAGGLHMGGATVRAMRAVPGKDDAAFYAVEPIVAVGSNLIVFSAARDIAPPAGSPVNLDAKFRDAQAHGVVLDKVDLDNLYALEMRTWAPTSERSRKQALV